VTVLATDTVVFLGEEPPSVDIAIAAAPATTTAPPASTSTRAGRDERLLAYTERSAIGADGL